MLTWYSGAVAVSLLLLIAATVFGATLPEILVGVSTGIFATTAMIFVVQKILEEIDTSRRAPALLISLSICAQIYQMFKYTWIEMGSSKGLVQNDTDWTSKDFFFKLQQEINLQDTWHGASLHNSFLGGIQTLTWEQYLDMTRDLLRRRIDDVLRNHSSYTDHDIVAILYVLKADMFCGSLFENAYRG